MATLADLVEQGVNNKLRDENGATVLHAVVYELSADGHASLEKSVHRHKKLRQLMRLLLELGADPNAFGPALQSPLHFAALHGAPLEVLHELIEAGGDVHKVNADGSSVLSALVFRNTSVVCSVCRPNEQCSVGDACCNAWNAEAQIEVKGSGSYVGEKDRSAPMETDNLLGEEVRDFRSK